MDACCVPSVRNPEESFLPYKHCPFPHGGVYLDRTLRIRGGESKTLTRRIGQVNNTTQGTCTEERNLALLQHAFICTLPSLITPPSLFP